MPESIYSHVCKIVTFTHRQFIYATLYNYNNNISFASLKYKINAAHIEKPAAWINFSSKIIAKRGF